MPPEIQQQVQKEATRIDKIDGAMDKKVSSVQGRETELTDAYVKKVDEFMTKAGKLDASDPERQKAENGITNFLKGIDAKNLVDKKQDFLNQVDAVVKQIEKREQLLETIEKTKKDIKEKQDAHLEAAKKLEKIYENQEHGTSAQYADAMEQYILSNEDLVKSIGPLIAIPELETDPSLLLATKDMNLKTIAFEQRMTFTKIKNNSLTSEMANASQPIIKLLPQEYPLEIPKTPAEYQKMVEGQRNSVLFAKRNLYIETGDEKYKNAYDETQEGNRKTMEKEGSSAIDAAEKVDSAQGSTLDTLANGTAEVATTAKEYTDSFAGRFDEIQRLQITDPLKAYEACGQFMQELSGWKGNIEGNAGVQIRQFLRKSGSLNIDPIEFSMPGKLTKSEFLRDLQKAPAIKEAFAKIITQYQEQSKVLASDVISRNPVITEFRDNSAKLFSNSQPFLTSMKTLMAQMEKKPPEPPSEEMMKKWVHPAAEGLLEDPLLEKVLASPAIQMFQTFEARYASDPSNNKTNALGQNFNDHRVAKMGGEMTDTFLGFQGQIKKGLAYAREVKKTAEIALKTEGTRSGFGGASIDALIGAGKILAATAGAVLAVELLPAGGMITPILVSSFGSTVGSLAVEAAAEGDMHVFAPKQFLKHWAMGALFCAGAGMASSVLGKAVSSGVGRLGKIENPLMKKAIDLMKTDVTIGKAAVQVEQAVAANPNALRDIIKKVTEGTKEGAEMELYEKAGEELAGQDPVLGFMFSVIPGVRKHATEHISAHAKAGHESKSMEYEYKASEKEQVTAELRKHKAPPELMEVFEKTGRIEIQREGLSIKITPLEEAPKPVENQKVANVGELQKVLAESNIPPEYKTPEFAQKMMELFPENPVEMGRYIGEHESPAKALELAQAGKREAGVALTKVNDSRQMIRETIRNSSLDTKTKRRLQELKYDSSEGAQQEMSVLIEHLRKTDPKQADVLESQMKSLREHEGEYKETMRKFEKMIDPQLEKQYMSVTVWGKEGMPKFEQPIIDEKGNISKETREQMETTIDATAKKLGLDPTEVPWLKSQMRRITDNLIQFRKENPGTLTPEKETAFIMDCTEKLMFQMRQSYQRSLGEHGIRHFTSNIFFALKDYAGTTIARDAETGKFLKPDGTPYASEAAAIADGIPAKVKLMIVAGMLNHDLGYATIAGHKFQTVGGEIKAGFEATDAHPATSRAMLAKDPLFKEMFGEQFDTFLEAMHSHDRLTTTIDEVSVTDSNGNTIQISKLFRAFQMADNAGVGGLEKLPPVVRNSREMRLLLNEMALTASVYTKSTEGFYGIEKLVKVPDMRADFTDPVKVKEGINTQLENLVKEGKLAPEKLAAAQEHYGKVIDAVQQYQQYYGKRLDNARKELKQKHASGKISAAERDNGLKAIDEYESGFGSINKIMIAPASMSVLSTSNIVSSTNGAGTVHMEINPAFSMFAEMAGGKQAVAQIVKPFKDYTEQHFTREVKALQSTSEYQKLPSQEAKFNYIRAKMYEQAVVSKNETLAKKLAGAKSEKDLIDASTEDYLDSLQFKDMADNGRKSVETSWNGAEGEVKMKVSHMEATPETKDAFSFQRNGEKVSLLDGAKPQTDAEFKSLYSRLNLELSKLGQTNPKLVVQNVYRHMQQIEAIKSAMAIVESRYALHIADKMIAGKETGETASALVEKLRDKDPARMQHAESLLATSLEKMAGSGSLKAQQAFAAFDQYTANPSDVHYKILQSAIDSLRRDEVITANTAQQARQIRVGRAAR